jgi:acyl-[acyl-carrier-protein]-phospholipid O-acyltransferase/long-chain-fatty-acid--[acyl-carrier-protein] ligase
MRIKTKTPFQRARLSSFSFYKEGNGFLKNSLMFHNISQFTSALVDNLFKFLTIFLLITIQGEKGSSEIMSMVGIIYVLPFLLFSSFAGKLADKISKQKFMVVLKFGEVLVTLVGILAFYFQSATACYALLFLLSIVAALMGPPKYSIIAELVPRDEIPKANGIITASTYLAVIVGMVMGGVLSTNSGGDYTFASTFCFWIALVGFFASLCVRPTPAVATPMKASPIFIKEVYDTLRLCRTTPFLLTSIFGSTFFLFVAAFVQMNMIPYAIETLGLTKEDGGNVFVAAAVGISIGGWIAGKLSRKEAEIGLSAIAGLVSGIALLIMPLLPFYWATALCLFLLGLTGGMYIVPFDAFYQTNTPIERRGQVVAATNFLSFFGVAIASLAISFFDNPRNGFFFIAFSTLTFFGYVFSRLSARSMHYLLRMTMGRMYRVDLVEPEMDESMRKRMYMFIPRSWMDLALLTSYSPNIHFYFIKEKKGVVDHFLNLFANVHIYTSKNSLDQFQLALMKEERCPFLIFTSRKSLEDFKDSLFFRRLMQNLKLDVEVLRAVYKKMEPRRYEVTFLSQLPHKAVARV